MATAGIGQGVPLDTASLKGETGGITGRLGVGEAASAGVRVAAGVPGAVEDDAGVGVFVAAGTYRCEGGRRGDGRRVCWRGRVGRRLVYQLALGVRVNRACWRRDRSGRICGCCGGCACGRWGARRGCLCELDGPYVGTPKIIGVQDCAPRGPLRDRR